MRKMKKTLLSLVIALLFSGPAWGMIGGGQINLEPPATTTVSGTSELATSAETIAGTDAAKVVTPDGLAYTVQRGTMNYAADAQANDTYVITMVPAIDGYVTGMKISFYAKTANTGAATINVNAKGAKTIKKGHDLDLADSDIEAGQHVLIEYDGTNFQMLSATALSASYDPANVAITGGTIDGTPTGGTTPAAGAFTTVTVPSVFEGYTTTATAAGTTTLTATSNYHQFFTGTTTQNAKLPVTSTLVLGQDFRIVNKSSGVVTVQSSGSNAVVAMVPNSECILTCILLTGTTAASWDYKYGGNRFEDTYTISPEGGDYTTIQAALTAHSAGGELFIVYPGTYTNDTINFSASNQTIKGAGLTPNAVITNTAQIINHGAFTGCRMNNIKLVGTYTTAIDMITGTGGDATTTGLIARDCHLEVAASGAIAGSPTVVNTTGAFKQVRGTLKYKNEAASGGQIKQAVTLGATAVVELRRVIVDIDGSGASDAITLGYGAGTGVINLYRCKVDVTDVISDIVNGVAYLGGTGDNEYMGNDIHVTCGGAKTAYGMLLTTTGALTVRTMYNHIHVVGGTNYGFSVGANCTVTSQFDDIIATAGNVNNGTLNTVSSLEDGSLTLTGAVHASLDIVTHGSTEAVTAATMKGSVHVITGAYVVTLPDAVIGMSGVFRASTAAEFSVKAAASDHFEMFDGTVISNADKQTSGGTKNEYIYIYCESANTWITIGINGAFTDGGA